MYVVTLEHALVVVVAHDGERAAHVRGEAHSHRHVQREGLDPGQESYHYEILL